MTPGGPRPPGRGRALRCVLALGMIAACAGCRTIHRQKARWKAFREDEETPGKIVAFLCNAASSAASDYLDDPSCGRSHAGAEPKPKPHEATADRDDARARPRAVKHTPSTPPAKPE